MIFYKNADEKYVKLKTVLNEPYDSTYQSRTTDSAVSGVIDEVLVEGFKNKTTEKIFKAIVRVK